MVERTEEELLHAKWAPEHATLVSAGMRKQDFRVFIQFCVPEHEGMRSFGRKYYLVKIPGVMPLWAP